MIASTVTLDGRSLTLDNVVAVARDGARVVVAPEVTARLTKARILVDEMAAGDEPHYGINTGFGALAEKKIPRDKVALLQKNLIESHAVGTGEPMPVEVARGLMMLRANPRRRPLRLPRAHPRRARGVAQCRRGPLGAAQRQRGRQR
jgi:histidine ammonia-lyase